MGKKRGKSSDSICSIQSNGKESASQFYHCAELGCFAPQVVSDGWVEDGICDPDGCQPLPSSTPNHRQMVFFPALVPPISSSFLFFSFSPPFPGKQPSGDFECWARRRNLGRRTSADAFPRSRRAPKAEQWWGQKGVSQFIPSTLALAVQVKAGPSTARLLSEP